MNLVETNETGEILAYKIKKVSGAADCDVSTKCDGKG